MRLIRWIGLCLAVCLIRPGLLQAAGSTPVVEVLVSSQEFDAALPWQGLPVQNRRGFGVMLDGVNLVTTEVLVRNATMIEIRRSRSGAKEQAHLIQAEPQINLALLRLEHPGEPVPRVQYAAPPGTGSVVSAEQITTDGEVRKASGRVVQWEVSSLPNSPYSALTATVLSDLNVDAPGAALFTDEGFAGVAMNYHPGTRTIQMLPATVVHAFVEDVMNPPYLGLAFAGFTWQALVDETKRRYLGVPPGTGGGVQVASLFPSVDARNPLQPNDVLLSIDGIAIDHQGYYQDDFFGRLLFTHLIKGLRSPGDEVSVAFIRDGVRLERHLVCGRYDDHLLLVPENEIGRPDAFLVDAGFVIRELNGRMLKTSGESWIMRTNPRLAHLYLTRQAEPQQPGDRIVILAAVLPDTVNVGYQHLRDEIVESVNGVSVRNLEDVFRRVDASGGLHRIGLRGWGVDLLIDPAERAVANARIVDKYRLPFLRREFP